MNPATRMPHLMNDKNQATGEPFLGAAPAGEGQAKPKGNKQDGAAAAAANAKSKANKINAGKTAPSSYYTKGTNLVAQDHAWQSFTEDWVSNEWIPSESIWDGKLMSLEKLPNS